MVIMQSCVEYNGDLGLHAELRLEGKPDHCYSCNGGAQRCGDERYPRGSQCHTGKSCVIFITEN